MPQVSFKITLPADFETTRAFDLATQLDYMINAPLQRRAHSRARSRALRELGKMHSDELYQLTGDFFVEPKLATIERI